MRNFKKFLSVLFLLIYPLIVVHAQFCGLHDDESEPEAVDRSFSSLHACVNNHSWEYDNNLSYIPSSENDIKTVKLVFHVMQRSDGSLNLQQENQYHLQWLENADDYLNYLMSHLEEEQCGGPTGSEWMVDSRIRFKTVGVEWHQNDLGWNNNSTFGDYNNAPLCDEYCFDNFYSEREKVLNIYILGSIRTYDAYISDPNPEVLRGCGPAYYGPESNFATLVGLFDSFEANPVGSFGDDDYIGLPWVEYPLLLHEIGHCLGLLHSNSNSQVTNFDLCTSTLIGWCNPFEVPNCSNNYMSYSQTKSFFSPLQIGHMHQLLSGGWRTAML